MANKQTAVEWLASNLGEHIVWEEKLIDLVEQAKEMEKTEKHAEYMRGWKDGYSCKKIKNKIK